MNISSESIVDEKNKILKKLKTSNLKSSKTDFDERINELKSQVKKLSSQQNNNSFNSISDELDNNRTVYLF